MESYKNVFKKNKMILILLSIMLIGFPTITISVNNKEKLDTQREGKIKKIKEIFEKRKKEIKFNSDDKKQKEIIHREFKPYGELVIEVLLPKLNMQNITYKRLIEEIYPIHEILREMKEEAFPYLLKKIHKENPYIRGEILWIIAYSNYKESILALIEALDDKEICETEIKDSPKWEPGGGKPKRICDIAYNRFIWKLSHDIHIPYEEIRKIEKEFYNKTRGFNDYIDRDIVIKEFKEWWQKNKERILSKYKEFKK